MEVGGGGRRRRLSDADVDSPNLRDFLRVRQGGGGGGRTLGAVLNEKRPPEAEHVNRTLLDIIRDDPSGGAQGNRKTWRTFRDKFRLRRAGAAWISSVPTPASDIPIPSANSVMASRESTRFSSTAVADNLADQNLESARPATLTAGLNSVPSDRAMMMMRHNSNRLPSLATNSYGQGSEFSTSFDTPQNTARMMDQSRVEENEEEGGEGEEERELEESGEGGELPARMSLMALLAETDRQMGLDDSPFIIGDDDGNEDEEDEAVGLGIREYNCCVCMVRHKGAAFIPCGHTFCRLCSRELWVQRGSCPLCNNFILEILDIF